MEKVREIEDALSEKQRELIEVIEHYKKKSKHRFSPTPSVVPEDAQSAEHVSADDMSQCGDHGDANSEGGNEPNVSQVPQSVGSSKRRCVVPVLDGAIPRGLPAVDVLKQGLSGYPHTASIGLKRLSKKDSMMKSQTVRFARQNSKNVCGLSHSAPRAFEGNSSGVVWSLDLRKDKKKNFPGKAF